MTIQKNKMNYKTLFATVFLLIIVSPLFSQPRDVSIMIDDVNRNAYMITIDQPEKITGETLRQRFFRSGLKEKTKNGATRYKGVTLSEISPGKVNIYTKVEKGPNNSSIVYMAVGREDNNFITGPGDSSMTENVKNFLQSLIKDADYHSADIDISNQISDLNKQEKTYQHLLDEQRSLQKKKSTIERRLVEIGNELTQKEEQINKKKTVVEDAKVKRGSIGN
jgi:hypothetical protein